MGTLLISSFCVNEALQVEVLEMSLGVETPNKYSVRDSSGQVRFSPNRPQKPTISQVMNILNK